MPMMPIDWKNVGKKKPVRQVDPKTVQEICQKCGKRSRRMDMKHVQAGFSSVWKCKDLAGCEKRQRNK